jgi:hypothetical protein
MGFVTRFEMGGRKDALYRSEAGDEVALEWEWQGVTGQNEVSKLKTHRVWRKAGFGDDLLKFGVLITYLDKGDVDTTLKHLSQAWEGAKWPLLVEAVITEPTKEFSTKRSFCRLNSYLFDQASGWRLLKDSPATPWKIDCSRWQWQNQIETPKQS